MTKAMSKVAHTRRLRVHAAMRDGVGRLGARAAYHVCEGWVCAMDKTSGSGRNGGSSRSGKSSLKAVRTVATAAKRGRLTERQVREAVRSVRSDGKSCRG